LSVGVLGGAARHPDPNLKFTGLTQNLGLL
jgi:hypothetical protein